MVERMPARATGEHSKRSEWKGLMVTRPCTHKEGRGEGRGERREMFRNKCARTCTRETRQAAEEEGGTCEAHHEELLRLRLVKGRERAQQTSDAAVVGASANLHKKKKKGKPKHTAQS